MNTHKNARLCFARRVETIEDITRSGLSVITASWSRAKLAWEMPLRVRCAVPELLTLTRPWPSWSCANGDSCKPALPLRRASPRAR